MATAKHVVSRGDGSPERAESAQVERRLWLKSLYEEHSDAVRALLVRMLGQHAEVDDLLHEAFLVAAKRQDWLMTHPGDPRAWLFGVAVRLAQNARRRRRVRRFFGLEAAEAVTDAQDPGAAAERPGQQFTVVLKSNPTTGERYVPALRNSPFQLVSESFFPDSSAIGAGGSQANGEVAPVRTSPSTPSSRVPERAILREARGATARRSGRAAGLPASYPAPPP